ncbi:hypothetical protein BH10ACT3_BH10ACT3_12750 [soil metagenome]
MQLLAPLASLVVGHTGGLGAAPLVLAHQGGWDEILMVLVPVSLFAALLYVANRRAATMAARNDAAVGDGEVADGTTGAAAATDGDAPPTAPSAREVPRNHRGGPI